MKRRREEELEDTGDSTFVDREKEKKPGMTNFDNFWSNEKDALLLQEIVDARCHRGPYGGLKRWNNYCWNMIHKRLILANPEFQLLTTKHLKDRQSLIHTTSNVLFSSHEPPQGELDRLVFDAFQQGILPPPPRGTPGVRRIRNRLGEVNVNNNSVRTTTNTTNVNTSGSCSNASHVDSEEQLASLLLEVQGDLDDDVLFASLSRKGKYGVFRKTREKMSHADFINYLVKYDKDHS